MGEVLNHAIEAGQGIWTLLFIALLAWVLKANDSREQRYISVIDKQADALKDVVPKVDGMAADVADIKRWLEPGGIARRGGGGKS